MVPIDSNLFQYVLLPLIIIIARICDVTIGTIRIIYVSKGLKYLAPILGFFEVFIWIAVVGQVINGNNNLVTYFAYAIGFALGTFVGIHIESKISVGYVIVRLMTRKEPHQLIEMLSQENIKYTKMNSEDSEGISTVILIIIKRKRAEKILHLIKLFNPKAFFSIEDLRLVSDPFETGKRWKTPFSLFLNHRKDTITNIIRNGVTKRK